MSSIAAVVCVIGVETAGIVREEAAGFGGGDAFGLISGVVVRNFDSSYQLETRHSRGEQAQAQVHISQCLQ